MLISFKMGACVVATTKLDLLFGDDNQHRPAYLAFVGDQRANFLHARQKAPSVSANEQCPGRLTLWKLQTPTPRLIKRRTFACARLSTNFRRISICTNRVTEKSYKLEWWQWWNEWNDRWNDSWHEMTFDEMTFDIWRNDRLRLPLNLNLNEKWKPRSIQVL